MPYPGAYLALVIAGRMYSPLRICARGWYMYHQRAERGVWRRQPVRSCVLVGRLALDVDDYGSVVVG